MISPFAWFHAIIGSLGFLTLGRNSQDIQIVDKDEGRLKIESVAGHGQADSKA